MNTPNAERPTRFHYAWVIAVVTFVVLLMTAGIRAVPSILMVPLEAEFGWSRTVISGAVAINIALFGLLGPFVASLMDRFGLKRVVLAATSLLTVAVALTTQMHAQWQLTLLWGVLVGAATGATSMVLAAMVATRWFDTRRGVVLGALSAANATGQLVFLPLLASATEKHGWRSASWIVAGVSAGVLVLVALFMRDGPWSVGLRPYGATGNDVTPSAPKPLSPFAALNHARKSRAFWILGGTFFVCGASTNGLIGTHLIAACHDVGIPVVRSAELLALMGIFDIAGTMGSGWLTDRYSPRHLLFVYYVLRGISLLFLPLALAAGIENLGWFAMFYGLDWIATVPPTVKLTSDSFGKQNTGVIYGWIGACHQMGASLAAFGAGALRTALGDYNLSFYIAGTLCIVAGISFLTLGKRIFQPRAAHATFEGGPALAT